MRQTTVGEVTLLIRRCEFRSKDDFFEVPVWIEYEVPVQIDALISLGFSSEYLETNTVEPADSSNESVWIALSPHHELPESSIRTCYAEIHFGKSLTLPGYVTVVDDYVTSCTALPMDLRFSQADILDEDNRDGLLSLAQQFQCDPASLLPVSYSLEIAVSGIPQMAYLDVPVAS